MVVSTHAYVLSRKYMEQVVNLKYNGIPVDILYSYLSRGHAIYPSLFQQGVFTSDLRSRIEAISVQSSMGSFIEWYATHINIPLYMLLWPSFIVFWIMWILFIIDPRGGYRWICIVGILILYIILIIIFANFGPTWY